MITAQHFRFHFERCLFGLVNTIDRRCISLACFYQSVKFKLSKINYFHLGLLIKTKLNQVIKNF